MTRLYRSMGLLTLAWLIGSCGGGDSIVGPPPPTVASVTVSRDTATLVPAATLQLTAAAGTASGESLPRTFSWSTSDPAKATVSNSGMVVGVAPGTATITATADGKSATATITVLDGGVVLPGGGTLNLQSGAVQIVVPADALASNANLSVAVSTSFAGDPRVIRGAAFDFGPPGTNFARPVVLRIQYDPANLPSGTEEEALELYLRTGSGWEVVPQSIVDLTANAVTAPISHFSEYAILTPDAVTAIAIGGVSPLTVGESKQLTATLTAAGGGVLTNRVVTWSTSDGTIASVNQGGNVTALNAGSATISASAGGITSGALITVNPVPVATVTVTPLTASIVVGATQQLAATLRDANGNTLTDRAIDWVSGTTAVATVDANGLVTAVGAGGPVTITATSEGKSGFSDVTVTPAPPPPVATVVLSAATTPMLIGATQVLTAALMTAGGISLSGRTVNWVSSNPSVLAVSASSSVSTSTGATVTVTAVGVGSATITATSESAADATTPPITVTLAPVNTVRVSPTSTSLVVGWSQQLTATLHDAANNELTGRSVTWASDNTAVATVNANGLVTAVSAGGPVTITATSETKTGTSSITVTLAPVATVTVSPSSATLVLGMTPTQQLTALTKDGNGDELTGRLITWSSSDEAVATVDENGFVTALGAGGTTITATSETKTGASSITVKLAPVNTVTVSPVSASFAVGATQQLTAALRDAADNVLADRTITWSSGDEAVATVSPTGLVTGVAAGGPITITASSETKTGTSSITVTPAPVATVTLSVPTTPMIVGGTQQLTSNLRDAAGTLLTGRAVSWASSDETVLAVSPASSTSGTTTVTAVGVGTATITATSASASVTTPVITVNQVPVATVAVSPSSASLVVGATQQLTATLNDAVNNELTGRAITWSSDNDAVATVSPTGLVTAVSAGGPVTITATSETKTGTSSITVTLAPVAIVTVSAPTTPMVVGETQPLTATTTDAGGTTLTGRTVSWVSSDLAVLTVSPTSGPSGTAVTVAAVGPGTATMTATSEAAPSATTPPITVNPVPVATVSATPASATLVLGITPTQQLTAVTTDANGNELTGRLVTWSSSNEAVATVDADGLVTAVGPGSTTITAMSETKTGTSSITVTLAPVATVAVSAPATSMVVDGSQELTATLRDAATNVLTDRTITWVSSNPAVLTVSPASGTSGTTTVTAVGVGTATITATSETKTGTATVSVQALPPPPPPGSFNEPSGMTLISERQFNALNEAPGWDTDSTLSIVQDATAPRSPSNVIRATFLAGHVAGNSSGHAGVTWSPGYRVLYIRYWTKYSANWQGQEIFNKQWYAWVNNSYTPIFFGTVGVGSDPLTPEPVLQNMIAGDGFKPPNLVPGAVLTRDQWDLVEIVLTGNTAGTANGVIDWYNNGVHIGHITGLQWSTEQTVWDIFEFYPVWGGVDGPPISQTQWIQWDHVYLSGKN